MPNFLKRNRLGRWAGANLAVRGLVLVALGWQLQLPCLADDTGIDHGERTLREQYAGYRRARQRDLAGGEDLFRYAYTFDWQETEVRKFQSEFLAIQERNRRAGVRLLSEGLLRIEFFREGDRELAFLRVRSTFSHPMHPGHPEIVPGTIYALSRDAGTTWKFNVLDCFSEEWVRRSFKSYKGVPAFR